MLSFRTEMTFDDLKLVREILTSTGFFENAPDEIDVAVQLAEEALKKGNSVDNYAFLFLEQEGRTVGYSCYAKVPCTLTTFEMYWLGIHNDLRGQGFGKLLMLEAIQRMCTLGAKKLVLQTAGRDMYIPTQKFYIACGFVLEARLKDYYSPGDDCLTYSMDF